MSAPSATTPALQPVQTRTREELKRKYDPVEAEALAIRISKYLDHPTDSEFAEFLAAAVDNDLVSQLVQVKRQKPLSGGTPFPEAILWEKPDSGLFQPVYVSDIIKDKSALIVTLPGAFTGTCHGKHLPDLMRNAAQLLTKFQEVIIVTGDSPDVAKEYALSYGTKVRFLSANGTSFFRDIGMQRLNPENRGLGIHSKRGAFIIEADGLIKKILVDEDAAKYENTCSANILASLE